MTRTVRASPIGRFLGDAAAAGGPFALLGLPPGRVGPGEVRAALERQLARVDNHPEAETPAADEVRLALHAAAAQLSDERVREEILAQLGVSSTSAAGASHPADPVAARGAGMHRPQAPHAPAAAPRVAVSVFDDEFETPPRRDPAADGQRMLVFIVAGFLFTVVAISIAAVLLFSGGGGAPAAPPGPPPAPVAQAPTAPAPPVVEETQPEPIAPRIRFGREDAAAALTALRRSPERLARSPKEASRDFTDAVMWLQANWDRLDVGQRRAANTAVIEYMHAAVRKPEMLPEALDAVIEPAGMLAGGEDALHADDVLPAAWSAGMLLRLSRDRELPSTVIGRVNRALGAALGESYPRSQASFESGAAAALSRMPLRVVSRMPRGEADAAATPLRRWLAGVWSVHDDRGARERAVLDAIAVIMLHGPDPLVDRAAFDSIQALTLELGWRDGELARLRLLEWFRDPRVASADLHVITVALAGLSGADGVTPRMVLAQEAPPNERETMRGQYAAAWGLADRIAPDGDGTAWQNAAVAALQRTPLGGTGPLAHLTAAVEFRLLNEAAEAIWRGDRDLGSSLAEQAASSVSMARGRDSMSGVSLAGRALQDGDGQWAVAFLGAGRNIPVRLERLAELERRGGMLGVVDGETLAEAALYASPAEVRMVAQRVAGRFADQPTLINGLLEQLPRAPRIESVSDLLSQVSGTRLPSVRDPEWMLLARRALVERLIEVLASGGETAGIERLVELLANSYGGGASIAPGTVADPSDAARDAWSLWRAEAEARVPNPHAPVPLERIDGGLRARLSLASGVAQTFAAHQVAIAEALAFVVAAESPVRAQAAADAVEEMHRARREAGHIFEQMNATERAILRLWMLRLGKEGQWVGG